MAGCDTVPAAPGDDEAWKKDILKWAVGGSLLGALLTYLYIADIAPLVISGGAATLATLAVIVGALAAGVVAAFIGYAVEWYRRLKKQSPETITISAFILCAGRNTGWPPPITDGDWTFNVGEAWAVTAPVDPALTIDEVRTRAAPDTGLAQAFPTTDPDSDDPSRPVFHVEISSMIGDYGAVGAAVGSVAGAIGGIIAGAAICVAAGILTLGVGFGLCALIIAAMALAGALAGGFAGGAIGGLIGHIADQFSDFNELGESVEAGCEMFLTGTWVTDMNHQHNEIHDLEAAVIIDCGVGSTSGPLTVAGAVGTGRHPSGRDP